MNSTENMPARARRLSMDEAVDVALRCFDPHREELPGLLVHIEHADAVNLDLQAAIKILSTDAGLSALTSALEVAVASSIRSLYSQRLFLAYVPFFEARSTVGSDHLRALATFLIERVLRNETRRLVP